MLTFLSGYTLSIESEDGVIYVTAWNPDGILCDHLKTTSSKRAANFIRIYGEA